MRKKLCVLLLGLCLISVSACGNKEVSGNSENAVASSEEGDAEDEDTVEGEDEAEDGNIGINIEDIAWEVDEGIVDGKRCVLLSYTNNSPCTIAGFEITFKERSDLTEEEKQAFYADIQEMFESDDEEIEELKEYPISMSAKTERVTDAGESVTNITCSYYTGYYSLKDINHYSLVEPDIATVRYVDEDNIYTVYYDYSSGKHSAESETEAAYQWPQTDLGSKIPKPDVKILESSLDMEELLMFDAYGMSLEQFDAYVKECKSMGYTVDPSGYEGFYSADNAEGYNIYLYYEEDDCAMSGTVESPYDKDEESSGDEESADTVSEDTEDADSDTYPDSDKKTVAGIRPEFKEAMDSYEAFYDEYCDFMKKYNANPSDRTLLDGYMDMLDRSVEMTEKFEAWDEGEMNDEELKYYLDVNNRVSKKMIDAME